MGHHTLLLGTAYYPGTRIDLRLPFSHRGVAVNWVVLIAGGFVEMLMALSLKESHGFSRLTPSLLFIVFAVLSFAMLSYALKTLPVGTAYAVWTGIGAAGTAMLGMIFLDEPRDLVRLVSIVLIIAGVVGLRLASGGAA